MERHVEELSKTNNQQQDFLLDTIQLQKHDASKISILDKKVQDLQEQLKTQNYDQERTQKILNGATDFEYFK